MDAVISPEDQARLDARYPKPRGRRYLVTAIALLVAVGLTWMVWAGLHSANKPVAARVEHFTVRGDTDIQVVIKVQRSNAARAAVCTVSAQSKDGVTVGSVEATVPADGQKLAEYPVEVKTVQRAVTAAVDNCR